MNIDNQPTQPTPKTPEEKFDDLGKNLESLEATKEKIQAEIDSLQHFLNDAAERLQRVSGYIDQTMGVMESIVKDAGQSESAKPELSIPERPVVDRTPGDIGNSQPASFIGPDGLVYSTREEALAAGQGYSEDRLTRFA